MNVAKFTRANYFEENLRTAASGFRIQKPSEFRVSGSNIFFYIHVINVLYLPQVKVAPPFITSQMFIKVINQT